MTATPAMTGYHMFLNVIAIQGTGGIGASAAASAKTGAPSVSLTTTQPQSLVFGVGNDWDNAIGPDPGQPTRSCCTQVVDTSTGDTYWTPAAHGADRRRRLDRSRSTTPRPPPTAGTSPPVEVLAANTSNYQP